MNTETTNALDAIAAAAPVQDWPTIDAQFVVLRLQVNDFVTGYITMGHFLPLLVEFRSRPDLAGLAAAVTAVQNAS